MIPAKELPQFVRDLMASKPMRGHGLNNWLFKVAQVLHPYRERGEIVALLEAATAGESIKAGESVHRWLMEAAWACRKAELTPDAAALERNATQKALA